MKQLVSDTGPLLHLLEADALDALAVIACVSIPAAVQRELRSLAPAWQADTLPWIRVHQLDPASSGEAARWTSAGLLESGEAEAIVLARKLKPDWFLTDDAAARIVAEREGLEAHGSLGVILAAAALGKIDRMTARRRLDGLAGSSLWVSVAVLEEARATLETLFD